MKVEIIHEGCARQADVGTDGLVLGRSPEDADVAVVEDASMSRRHGRVFVKGQEVWYEDLGSSNGSWMGKERLSEAVRLDPGRPISLGRSTLKLVSPRKPRGGQSSRETDLTDGMSLRLSGSVGKAGLEEALRGGEAGQYLSALAEFVEHLVVSRSDDELLSTTLKKLKASIPEVQRAFLVAWPAEPDGSFRHLLPPEEGQGKGPPISRTLASQAVQQGEALMFYEDFKEAKAVAESVKMHGIRSAVYVPLIDREEQEAFAVLCVDSPSPSVPIDTDAFHFVRAVAGLLSSAVQAENLREEARKKELRAQQVESHRRALVGFLNIASHDLKNPLTIIQMCAKLIERFDDRDQTLDMASRILDASARAEGLILSYMEVSQLAERDTLKLHLKEFDLRRVVDEEGEFVSRALSRRFGEVLVTNQVESFQVRADLQKFRQILGNLISNAIKYSPDGSPVEVTGECCEEQVVLHVRDFGKGISKEDQTRLFKRFERLEEAGEIPGTGLGLWLANSLVQAHRGTMWVESVVGEGSTFSFSIPNSTKE